MGCLLILKLDEHGVPVIFCAKSESSQLRLETESAQAWCASSPCESCCCFSSETKCVWNSFALDAACSEVGCCHQVCVEDSMQVLGLGK